MSQVAKDEERQASFGETVPNDHGKGGDQSSKRVAKKKKKKERKRDDIKGVGKKMEIGSRDGRWERR